MNENKLMPVREMVLYKHGVGFFVRAGRINGTLVDLTFSEAEINDVLKSLFIFDRAGGQVLGIHYQTPMNRAARLTKSSVNLSGRSSLRDLLLALQGREAVLEFETASGSYQNVSGRVIGLDEISENGHSYPHKISVLALNGQVNVYPFDQLHSISIVDSEAEHDLGYFLDTTRGDDNKRTITVALNDDKHRLMAYYVAPSPTWRVSYRIFADSDQKGGGQALLQGWGIFDNQLDEDLEEVKVTLVAGQPISFVYDLYASHIPQRPVVDDNAKIAPGPVEFAADSHPRGAVYYDADDEEVLMEKRRTSPGMWVGGSGTGRPASTQDFAQATPPVASTQEAGEYFQYIVETPITVRRGESALVPIIRSQIRYTRELLYNGTKLPHHPVAALRFENNTGLTLERGPVTLVEDGTYTGDAVVPFTKAGNEVYLAYAVEQGIRVTERWQSDPQTAGLNINNGLLIFEEYTVQSTLYVIENSLEQERIITIEAPINTGWELVDTALPDVETANERRWRVAVPGRSQIEFVRRERRGIARQEHLRSLTYRHLQDYLANRWLDKNTYNQLSEMLDSLAMVQQALAIKNKLVEERQNLYEQQEQLRKNLGALQANDAEGALRSRLLGQLEMSQNRLEEINGQIDQAGYQAEQAEQRVQQIVNQLGG